MVNGSWCSWQRDWVGVHVFILDCGLGSHMFACSCFCPCSCCCCCYCCCCCGCWLLVVGCWLLVVGCWLLVVGCGCWLWLLLLLLLLRQGIKGQRYCRMDKPCSVIVDKLKGKGLVDIHIISTWFVMICVFKLVIFHFGGRFCRTAYGLRSSLGTGSHMWPSFPPMDVCTSDGLKEKGPGGSSNATMADYGRGVWHYCFTISSHIKPICTWKILEVS